VTEGGRQAGFRRFLRRRHMKRLLVWLSAIVLAVGLVACQVEEEPVELSTIAEIAVADGNFTNLVAALTAADLVGPFADEDAGPFTVFAPTDAAFGALIATVNEILELEEGDDGFIADLDALVAAVGLDYVEEVLLYHVLAGKLMAADVVQVTELDTLLAGFPLTVTVDGAVVVLEGVLPATITDVDIEASNGVIHVIDFVLLPYLPDVLTE
jgi:transforming growth factor-beta-induced protein